MPSIQVSSFNLIILSIAAQIFEEFPSSFKNRQQAYIIGRFPTNRVALLIESDPIMDFLLEIHSQ